MNAQEKADVFERVRRGEISPAEGADLLAKQRRQNERPSKPGWMPRPLYLLGVIVLGFFIPKLFDRS